MYNALAVGGIRIRVDPLITRRLANLLVSATTNLLNQNVRRAPRIYGLCLNTPFPLSDHYKGYFKPFNLDLKKKITIVNNSTYVED